MSTPVSLYILKAARKNHSASPQLEHVLKAYRRAVVESVVGKEHADLIIELLATLDDEAFANAINDLAMTVKQEPPLQEPEPLAQVPDTTYEILKAKYGVKR